jgi:CRISPR type IV-associated protein Csf2
MRTYVFEGTVTALTSISHIGESYGINAKLRREKIVQINGSSEEVPIISGNSIRGILRDRGMLHLLRALGYGVNEADGTVQGLSLAAFYFLFSGGALTKTAGRGIDVDEARRWRDLIPLVALFGGAMGNQIMPGKAKIGKLIPVCRETAHLLPPRFIGGHGQQSIWDFCQEEAYTRRDDEKSESLRQLIAPEVRGLLETAAKAKRDKAGTIDEKPEGDTGQKQQMRYFVETLAAGTIFFWDITLDDVSDLEFEACCVTLAEFSRFPYLGGKSAIGHGKVAIQFDDWLAIDSRAAPTGQAISRPLGHLYAEHLQQRGREIRSLIDGLS